MKNHSTTRHSLLLAFLLTCWCALAHRTHAQTQPEYQHVDQLQPINVTTQVFQLSAPRGKHEPLNDQVFRVTTANYQEEEKWLTNLKKLYPEFTPTLLKTYVNRAYRVSKPTVVKLGKVGNNNLEVWLNGAQSPGDGTTPGTSLLIDINLNQGLTNLSKPLTYALQSLEVESGKTYFFAARNLKLNNVDYVNYMRVGASPASFDKEDIFFVFAFSVDLNQPKNETQYFGEKTSVALQSGAVKKVQPEMPAALQQAGLTGKVQVRVEISPAGKVTRAITYNSSLPEMNAIVLAAARQWEFGPALFAENKKPIHGFLTFEFPANAAAPEKPAPTK